MLSWAKSDANTNSDSGRQCYAYAIADRAGRDGGPPTRLNLYLFKRYVSVECGQRYRLHTPRR